MHEHTGDHFRARCAMHAVAFDLKRSKGGGQKLDKEALRHELRRELGLSEGVSEKTRDTIIVAVAEEGETEAGK